MGQGDQCAPSFALQHPLTVSGQTLSVGYDNLAIHRLLATGAAVVVTDHVGLGATDRLHTYVNRVDAGHAVLDAVRAARALPGTSLSSGSRVGLYGYSEGGGATASAAELQPTYAPDVPLARHLRRRAARRPDRRHEGDRRQCPGRCPGLGDQRLRPGVPRHAGRRRGEPCRPRQAAHRDAQAAGPVRVATGVQDDIVPHAQARQLAVDWCRKSGNVTYEAVSLPDLGDKLLTNHLAPLLTDQGAAISWLTDRLEGKPATSNCWTMPFQR